MTISSSLNAGVSGLSANATRLAAISDNIANSSTNGYRRVETDFHSMVIGHSKGGYTAGGVRTTNMRLIDDEGSLISTSNATNLAVQGRGMIPVAHYISGVGTAENAQMLMTSTGSFRVDKDGYLVTASGLVLMGFKANEDGTIPPNSRDSNKDLEAAKLRFQQIFGEPTTKIKIAANLPATDTQPSGDGKSRQMSVEYYDNMGTVQHLYFKFTPTKGNTTYSNEWSMSITDSAQNNAEIGRYKITFNDDAEKGGTLKSVTLENGASGGAYNSDTGAFVVNVTGGPLEINLGLIGENAGLTQKGKTFTPAEVDKNGTKAGNMTSNIEVNNAGEVFAPYDNGAKKLIYKIPLVDMPNLNGMISMDNQTYTPSNESGRYFLWDAGEGPTGTFKAYALEESTTDVASEMTAMIQTQRSYSSNAKVIQTASEILQETTSMIR